MSHEAVVNSKALGKWKFGGAQVVEHLEVMVDIIGMRLTVIQWKVQKVLYMVRRLILETIRGRRYVSTNFLRSFYGTCISLMLALPFARFYTLSLYW